MKPAVTKEEALRKARLVITHPDGDHIAAAQHFADTKFFAIAVDATAFTAAFENAKRMVREAAITSNFDAWAKAIHDLSQRGGVKVMECDLFHQGKDAETDSRIISRSKAKAAGLTRYFTGLPCSRGHIAERNVAKRDCIECNREYQRARKERDPERVRALARTWARANRAAATTAR
jgi:hypothetical protein